MDDLLKQQRALNALKTKYESLKGTLQNEVANAKRAQAIMEQASAEVVIDDASINNDNGLTLKANASKISANGATFRFPHPTFIPWALSIMRGAKIRLCAASLYAGEHQIWFPFDYSEPVPQPANTPTGNGIIWYTEP